MGLRPEWTFYRELAAAMGLELFGGHISHPDQMVANMLAGSGKVTLEEVRASEHGLFYGEWTMGHFLDYSGKHDRSVDVCPEHLARELKAALVGDANST